MTKIISISGKGGVGKTTFSSLLIKFLTEHRKQVVLAVDADPNSTLGETLGVSIENTIGNLREELLKEKDNLPAGISKQEHVNYQIQTALTEEDKFDLITMGRSEGPGCYCYINSILRTHLDNISSKYEYVIIDNEAGMEHLSRRTTLKMDNLFVISEPTHIGIKTANRILNLAFEMGITIGKHELIINKLKNGIPEDLVNLIDSTEFQSYNKLQFDTGIEEFLSNRRSLLELPDTNKTYRQVKEIAEKI